MQSAINLLTTALEERATWNIKQLEETLQTISQYGNFSSKEAATAFGQTCWNFTLYAQENGIKSMGRNQFMAWFKPELAKTNTGYIPGIQNSNVLKPIEPITGGIPAKRTLVVPGKPKAQYSQEDELRSVKAENVMLRVMIKDLSIKMDSVIEVYNSIMSVLDPR